MKKKSVPYRQTGYFNNLVLDYLDNSDRIKPFFRYLPAVASLPQALADKAAQGTDRKTLLAALHDQYREIELSEAEKKSLELLSSGKTFTVTTAHQPSLLLGPLYFIYKTVSAINLAKEFRQAQPDHEFVPVFWLGSEDHDVAELNHIYLFGKEVRWDTPRKGAFGRMSTAELNGVLDELKVILGDSAEAKDILQVIREAYNGQRTIAQATRYLLHALFAGTGLLVLDADDTRLKKIFVPVMKDELLHSTSFSLVNDTVKRLEEQYEPQVKPREINLFYLDGDTRERIIREENGFRVNHTAITWTTDRLLEELDANPERFSPNVVLRPLYQETVLPNVAFVGGGAEVSYFMELKPVFERYKINFPMVFLRNCVLVTDTKMEAKWNKLGFLTEDLFLSADELNRKYIRAHAEGEIQLQEERKLFEQAFIALRAKAEAIDPSLVNAVEAEKAKQLNTLQSIEQKFLKAKKKKHEDALQAVRNVKEKLFPNGGLQERTESFLPYYLKYGKGFIATLLDTLDPLDFRFTVLSPDAS